MKKALIIIFLCLLCVLSYGQRTCSSVMNINELQQNDPVGYQRVMALESQIQTSLARTQSLRSIPSSKIVIPVVVHVVYHSIDENISDAQIYSQIDVLNEDFQRLNADRINTPDAFAGVAGSANFEFKPATIDPNGYVTNGITRTYTAQTAFTDNNNVKYSSFGGHDAWNTQQYLNIWVCNLSGTLMGYAQFPSNFSTHPNADGVVIKYNYFGRDGSAVSPYHKGRTATHEVGHWLNLFHIAGDDGTLGCHCNGSDNVADTPNQSIQSFGWPFFPQTDCCSPSNPGIMFMNFMDYTDDACMNLFTNGQINRMRALFDTQNGIRRSILANSASLTENPITGPSTVCTSPSTFSINNLMPNGSVTWSVSGPFSLSNQTNTSVSVTKTGSSNSNGILTATINGNMVITKSITPCFIHINGPSVICGFYNDYEIPNLPAGISGSQITWSSNTPIISIVGSNIGAGVTIRANGALGGIGVLSANVNGTQISKTISILGTSFGNNIEGPSTMPIDSYQDYSLNQFTSVIFGPDDPFCGCFYYQWTCSPNLTIEYEGPSIEPDFVSQSSGDPEPEYPDEEELGWSLNAQVHAVGCGSGWIRLAVHVNGDSTIYNKSVDVTCSGQQSSSRSSGVGTFSVAVSPNPVDDRLTVNIQPVVVGQAKQKTSYDVLLRNFGGTVVRRLKTSTSFDLDVSDLPGGVYFLSVSDDIGSQPIVKQILIK